jgi:hypothetical protein
MKEFRSIEMFSKIIPNKKGYYYVHLYVRDQKIVMVISGHITDARWRKIVDWRKRAEGFLK